MKVPESTPGDNPAAVRRACCTRRRPSLLSLTGWDGRTPIPKTITIRGQADDMERCRVWGAGAPFFAAVLVTVLGAAPTSAAEPQDFSPTGKAKQLVFAPRIMRPTIRPEIAPQVDRLVYTVIREGQDVGTHRVEFRSDGNRLNVRTSTDIAVR